jgi:hypothetical protein
MPQCEIIKDLREFIDTPSAGSVSIGASKVVVRLADEERALKLSFSPYQAVRITTIDCVSSSEGLMAIPGTVVQLYESQWIKELKVSLFQVDITADFLKKSRHFLIMTENDLIEIIAWNCELVL